MRPPDEQTARRARPGAAWWLRDRLPPPARRAVRAVTDPVLYPIGSLRSVKTDEKIVALTFDDGPDPAGTGPILDVLAEHGAGATFFVLVDQASEYPWLVRRAVEEGHEVGLHGLDHRRLTRLPREAAARSLGSGARRLQALSGRPVRWFRPPFGSQSLASYVAVRRLGMLPVVWSRDAADWVDDDPVAIAARALEGLQPGSIILFHDGLQGDPDEVPPATSYDRAGSVRWILAGLAERGYRAVSVGRLTDHGHPRRTAWFRP